MTFVKDSCHSGMVQPEGVGELCAVEAGVAGACGGSGVLGGGDGLDCGELRVGVRGMEADATAAEAKPAQVVSPAPVA